MKETAPYKLGIDIGSTTLKTVVLDTRHRIVYKSYRRHRVNVNAVLTAELNEINNMFPDSLFSIVFTGSAGMGIAERTGAHFVQEVVASAEVVARSYPQARTLIDLGGEDAKMVFFSQGRQPDIRMNGSCAGGTGAFIDQMADLMNITVEELAVSAEQYAKVYPIASRCGVFAKTDVQNLLSKNVKHSDIAMSILHSVAIQSITTLARGCDIEPKVICIGGPLTFIPSLRKAFMDILALGEEDFIVPDNGELFPAWGAALSAGGDVEAHDIGSVMGFLREGNTHNVQDSLPPLFTGSGEYESWKSTRRIKPLTKRDLPEQSRVGCFLGIDSGSTTTKIVLLDEDGDILFDYYSGNEGDPLKKAVEGVARMLEKADKKGTELDFKATAVTGYGEELVKSALGLDYGIVETMAHLCGAQHVDPEVSFILDIGGQDMKSLFINNGVISKVELNEACSSGCGSFLQNSASAMSMSTEEFTRSACEARYPSDLGTRCTVFMNSKVKQALRDNASSNDIAAGLAYSVVKNCLYKVLKISNLNALGDNIVIQGGTFRNDSVFRALELLSGKSVSSTDHPELMGAFGAALYARKMYLSTGTVSSFGGGLPNSDSVVKTEIRCQGCTNNCQVIRFRFPNGNNAVAGNKCEKIFSNAGSESGKGYNAFELKNGLLFERGEPADVKPGAITIGIPRVLNMYENYPFWHTLLTECGLKVVLSPESNFEIYRKGVGNVMSDNICFPAKLVHGHILSLCERKVDRIFYPMVIKEEKEFGESSNSFNCPVVSGYPDVIRSSMDPHAQFGIPFDKPVVTFSNEKALRKACLAYMSSLGVNEKLFDKAFRAALEKDRSTKKELIGQQKRKLEEAILKNETVFIVAGRPYHADALVNQKTGQIISDQGVHVLTEDVFRASGGGEFGSLNAVSQWGYPNRTLQAAIEVSKLPANVQLLQLNSFGCGPDSFFMDEIGSVLKGAGKNHTVIRIDEIASPGSVKLRVRSLVESLKMKPAEAGDVPADAYKGYEVSYKESDRRKTILIPWLADFISPFVPAIGEMAGYKIVNVDKSCKASAEAGLKYGNNEVCYPCTLVMGDIVTALQSGKYDTSDVVVAITQTGGQCRATNYVAQIKATLKNAGFGDIPVLVLSAGKIYQNEQSAFRIPALKIINIAIYAILYGDALNQMYAASVIREQSPGTSRALFDKYIEEGIEAIKKNDHKMLTAALGRAVADFNSIAIHEREYVPVGLVGEIYVKYNNYGQAYITQWLQSRGMEVVTPPILDFVMQYFVNSEVNLKNGVSRASTLKLLANPLMLRYMNSRINRVEHIMENFRFHRPAESIFGKAEAASEILDLSNQFGEGWSVAAEVSCYARTGVDRVVCVQPFGCIANHVIAKGIEKRLKKYYPSMNILYLDLDGGTGEVNLQNRLYFLVNQYKNTTAEAI